MAFIAVADDAVVRLVMTPVGEEAQDEGLRRLEGLARNPPFLRRRGNGKLVRRSSWTVWGV